MRVPRAALFSAVSLLSVLTSGASVASAAPASDPEGKLVKDMIKDAVVAEKAGKCKESLAILRQAAAIRETGEVLLHVGECQARNGTLLEALKSWENAEDAAKNEHDKATLAALLPRMEAVRARIPTVLLRVPKDAKKPVVKIDDQVQAPERLLTPILLNPGDHTVSVTADGREPFSVKLPLAERDAKMVDVVLPPAAGAAVDPLTPRKRDEPLVPIGTWIGGGAAVVLLASGIVAFAASGSAASDGKAACATQITCDPSQQSSVHTLDALALGLWVGAGASAGFATTWFFLNRPKRGEAPPSQAAGLTVVPGGAWIRGTF